MKVAPKEYGARTSRVGGGGTPMLSLVVCDASDREDWMALKLEDKKVVVAEVNAVAAKALSVVGAEYRGLTVTQMTDLARQGAQGRRVSADRQEHARAQGRRRHVFRVHFSGAEGTARPRILQRRSRRGRAHGQGVRERQRQAGDDARVAGRAIAQAPRTSTAWHRCRRARRRCRCCWVSSRRRSRSSLVRWRLPTPSWCGRSLPFSKPRKAAEAPAAA